MRLTIKDPEARRLAAAIAQETGETLTSAVTQALAIATDDCAAMHTRPLWRNFLPSQDGPPPR